MADNPLASDLDHILEHTRNLWDELRGERIFITGGTGFFGCWLLESFAWAYDRLGLNASALVLTRNLDAFRKKAPHLAAHPAIRFHIGDVRSFVFPEGQFSYIIHAASESSIYLSSNQGLAMLDTIILGTRRVLEFARQCEAQKFLFTSSGAIYGRQDSDILRVGEDSAITWQPYAEADMQTIYREGKYLAELECNLYAQVYKIKTKIARCFAFVGPYLPLDSHFAIGNFIWNRLKGEPILIKGDGTPSRSYLYAADLTIWLWTILFRGEAGRPYNVGSDQAVTILDLAEIISSLFQPRLEVTTALALDPNKAPERYIPSIQRAREELGLQPWTSLKDALINTIQWHSET